MEGIGAGVAGLCCHHDVCLARQLSLQQCLCLPLVAAIPCDLRQLGGAYRQGDGVVVGGRFELLEQLVVEVNHL